jgi:type I restriction enzyme S subunit
VSVDVREISLHDAVKFIVDNRGKTVPTADNGIPLIATNCIKNNGLFPVFEKIRFVSEETYKTWFRSHPEPGDIIFVNKGTPGRVCLVPNPVNFCIAQDMVALRVDESVIYPKYLFAALRSDYIQNVIENMHVGTLIPHFKKSDFERLMIPVPDEVTQKYIGNLYYDLSMAIELNNQINKNLEEMAQAIFKSWFVDFEPFKDGEFEESELGLIPKGWKIVELEEICSIQNGFAFKSSDYQDTGCRLIRTTNITSNGYVNNNDIKFLPQSFYESEKYKNYRFECFDTVLVMVGASIGKIGLITEYNLPSLQNQNMWRFRANNREISSVYIHYVVRRVNEFVSNWATGSARDFYRKESFQRAKCVLPPKNVMKEFRLLTDSLFIQISSNIMENALLLEIRDILLPKLMSGEIRVPVEEVV